MMRPATRPAIIAVLVSAPATPSPATEPRAVPAGPRPDPPPPAAARGERRVELLMTNLLAIAVFGYVLFAGTLVWVATFPVTVSG